jgi:hypothetical protein
VEIPTDPIVPWKGAIIGSDVDDAVERMAHVALTDLCERHLMDTVERQSGGARVAATPQGHVRPHQPTLQCWLGTNGQVHEVPVQLAAQH